MENNQKTFGSSILTLDNRSLLSLSGVEKVFGANENKVVLKVSGSALQIIGHTLTVEKLDIDTGNILVRGIVDELRYTKSHTKEPLLKRIFK